MYQRPRAAGRSRAPAAAASTKPAQPGAQPSAAHMGETCGQATLGTLASVLRSGVPVPRAGGGKVRKAGVARRPAERGARGGVVQALAAAGPRRAREFCGALERAAGLRRVHHRLLGPGPGWRESAPGRAGTAQALQAPAARMALQHGKARLFRRCRAGVVPLQAHLTQLPPPPGPPLNAQQPGIRVVPWLNSLGQPGSASAAHPMPSRV